MSASVHWVRRLIAKPGHHDRLNVRLVAFGANKKAAVLDDDSTSRIDAGTDSVRITLTKREARMVQSAPRMVLSVSQQYDKPTDSDKKIETNYVTTTDVPGKGRQASSSPRAVSSQSVTAADDDGRRDWHYTDFRNCSGVRIHDGADLSSCDLGGARLNRVNLGGVNLSNA